jgi:hypothetical protein
MKIRESTVEEVLRSEDIETLFQHGAPDNEYTPEARGIVSALALLNENDVTEDRLFAVVRSVWARLFGLGEDDLEMRTAAFRQVAHRIIEQDSPHNRP